MIRDPIIVRNRTNAIYFEDLYRRVGYGPKLSDEDYYWRTQSLSCWSIQDTFWPGNMVGALDPFTKKLHVAFGCLPMSSRLAFGHSLAIERSAFSAELISDVMCRNLLVSANFAGITHYLGTAFASSRFAGRLHNDYSEAERPKSHRLFPALAVLVGDKIDARCSPRRLRLQQRSVETAEIPDWLQELWVLLAEPHESLRCFHEVRHFVVVDPRTSSAVAFIIAQRAPEYFTAVNMFRLAFCFLVSPDVEINEVYRAMESDVFFDDLEINLVGPHFSMPSTPRTSRSCREVIWWSFSLNEAAQVMKSVRRVVQRVQSKYSST